MNKVKTAIKANITLRLATTKAAYFDAKLFIYFPLDKISIFFKNLKTKAYMFIVIIFCFLVLNLV
jgi:hypothetical protein